jgi:lysozyme family protein
VRQGFDTSLAAVLLHEGGYVNDPQDPGGATNRGITQAVYNDWRFDRRLEMQDVKLLTPAETSAIYKLLYWNPICGDNLPAGVDYCTFDFAVNSGVNRASRYLQRAADVLDDGQIGPVTVAAVGKVPANTLIEEVCDERLAFLQRLPTFAHFGKGWTARVNDVRAKAKAMAA